MNKRIRIALTSISTLAVIGIAIALYDYYTCTQERFPYHIKKSQSDTLRIAFIGDSWAFMHREYDAATSQYLSQSLNRPVRLMSFGICGLTSSEIYENIFENDLLKDFLSIGHDYCILSAGINDTYKKMSPTYYSKSIEHLIYFFLYNDISPIIIEIPDYDIYKAYERQRTSRKIIRQISMLINGLPIDCKKIYRDELYDLISSYRYRGKIKIIPYKLWNSNYASDQKLYYRSDGIHLNRKGYERLFECLPEVLQTNTYPIPVKQMSHHNIMTPASK